MKKANEKYLLKRFSFLHLIEGFECDDGWFELIKGLCEKLEKLMSRGLLIVQVKEKSGGLQFYFYVAGAEAKCHDEFNKVVTLVYEAEAKSFKICEICGKPGKTKKTKGGLTHQTRCESCREERNGTSTK